MNPKIKWAIILIISVIMTVLTLLFLQKYLSEETQRRLAQAEPQGVAIVVFGESMQADQQLFAENLALREFPEQLVSAHWLQQDQVGGLIGRRMKYAVAQGEPLTESMLMAQQLGGLSRQLPDDFYAVTIAATESALHNGLLAVGDTVDVVFKSESFGQQVQQHVFSNLRVFDLGRQEEGYSSGGITLLVSKADIAKFTRYKNDDYALWVRPQTLPEPTHWWQPIAPAAQVLSWQVD